MNAGVIELFGRSFLERYCLCSSFHTFMNCVGQMSKLSGEPIKRRSKQYDQMADVNHAVVMLYLTVRKSHGQIHEWISLEDWQFLTTIFFLQFLDRPGHFIILKYLLVQVKMVGYNQL